MVGLNRLNGRNLKFTVLFKTIRDRDLGGGGERGDLPQQEE